MKIIKNNTLIKFLPVLLALSLSGCVYLVIGGLGAVGGYVVSPDTVEGINSYGQIETWDAAYEVISIMGVILESQEEGGIIIAKVNGAKVTVTISQMSPSAVKMTLKARKTFMPKIALAQDIYVKIMNYLGE